MKEIERIKKEYLNRKLFGKDNLYSFFRPDYLFTIQEREKEIIRILGKLNYTDLVSKKVLDLGCGNGHVLRDFLKYGASPVNCFGIDLLPENIEMAKRLSPHMDFQCGNAENLPYDDGIFDIILCFTVFSSVFDKTMKMNISKEMIRVLNPNGIIIWYDYFMNNPWNPNVRGIKKREISNLFPNCKVYLKRVTLAPPLWRLIASYSFIVCNLLGNIKIFNTHYIGAISKGGNVLPGRDQM